MRNVVLLTWLGGHDADDVLGGLVEEVLALAVGGRRRSRSAGAAAVLGRRHVVRGTGHVSGADVTRVEGK